MVEYRSPLIVFLLGLFTIGVYVIYWLFKTTLEMKDITPRQPDVFYLMLFIVPGFGVLIAVYYFWKYSAAIADISGANHLLLFVTWLLPPLAMAISQLALNKFAVRDRGNREE